MESRDERKSWDDSDMLWEIFFFLLVLLHATSYSIYVTSVSLIQFILS